MACKIKTLLQCKHCGHELEVASYYMTVRDDRRPLLWCPDCDILYQYFGPEEVVVDRSASVEYVRALANEFLVEMSYLPPKTGRDLCANYCYK